MTATRASVEEQLSVLLRGVEYGDAHIERTMREELRERLAEGRPLRVYCGFDPTAVDLTLGHLVPMLKLRQFQRFGHEVTFLMGTMTGIVGDPSDKTAARQMLTSEAVEANSQTWLRQAFRVLDPRTTIVRKNADWLAPLTLTDVVQLASHFTVSQFLERQAFRQRLDEGKPLYVHEFIYALMQAYDALTMKTDVQVGGVDQLFNIMAGRHLQQDLGERGLVAVTTPLLVGTDGRLKMSKSVGNYIGLDDAPADMYGRVMNIPDSLLANYYTLLSDLPTEELVAVERGLGDRTLQPMAAKKRLAHAIVALLHNEAVGSQAQAEFERVFQRREQPQEAEELPHELDSGRTEADITLLLSQKGLVSSRGEARRLLAQGAIALDGEPLSTARAVLREGSLLKVGRHRFFRIVAA